MKLSISRDIVVGTPCDHKECDNRYEHESYWGIVNVTVLGSSELEAIYCPIHSAGIVSYLTGLSKPTVEEE